MARARRSSRSKTSVKVNFKDVESRTRVNKEGDYPLRITEATAGKSSGGNDQIEFVLEVTEGEFKGAKAWFYCPLLENSLWKLHAFLTALGEEVPDDEMDIDLSDLVGKEVVGVFTPDTYNGKRSFKMTDFTSIDDYEGEDKKGKGKKSKKDKDEDEEKSSKKSKSKKDEPDYDDMDEDELRDLYIEREIGTKKEAKKLDEDELREALEEADAAAAKKGGKGKSKKDDDEDEEKSSKKDKKKKAKKKYDKDDIEDMDEDELQEVIDESGIDVDLDDFKKLPKKVKAVIDALEEEDLLEDE